MPLPGRPLRRALGAAFAVAALGVPLGACRSAVVPKVDGERMHAAVVHQVEAGPRVPGTPGHAIVEKWIVAELTRTGGRVERQAFHDSLPNHPLDLVNVIGRFGPASGRRIVLCAHYDSRPWSDQDPDSTLHERPCPGANDGGSGVAVLLEMATLMSQRPPSIGIDLVFFDGEDLGRPMNDEEFCRGSLGYAARLGSDRPVAAFLFDMVGDRDLDIYPEQNSVERAANLVDMVLDGAHATSARHFHREPLHRMTDDHIPLLDAGLPAIDIIDFDYPAWHTMHDLPDQVSARSLAEVGRVAAWLVYRSPISRGR